MIRVLLVLALAGCAADAPPVASEAAALSLDVTRELVAGDIYHYAFTLRVGDTPNARLRIHRVVREAAPFRPLRTSASVMLLHGDFATFSTNFLPGLAPYLASRDVDVFGFDRRWASAEDDTSDFAAMGFAQEVDDVGSALAAAQAVRILGGARPGGIALAGFSRGGQLAYAYAATEGPRRRISGLAPLDVFAAIAPEDEADRQVQCESRDFDREALDAGMVDSDNSFLIEIGSLALAAPDDASPFFDGMTNREAMRRIVEKTYLNFPITPWYHLAIASSDEAIATWLADAPPHQSMREAVESETLWCGEAPLPLDLDLSRIRVPLFYLGAAGGFGTHGLYSTTLVGSRDVTTHIVRTLPPGEETLDYGHADLLFGPQARDLAWAPLGDWLLRL